MAKLPAIHLYPGDWYRDAISGCSLAAQGLWLRMMFVGHDSQNYGHIFARDLLTSKTTTARRCGCSVTEFDELFNELLEAGVPSIEGGIVVCRRMVRDASIRAVRANAGRKGGKQKSSKRKAFARSRAQAKDKQNTENEIEIEDEYEVDSVDVIVRHYQSYHPRARAGAKDRSRIAARLREGFSTADLCLAIDGCHVSPWHCGTNDEQRKYQNLELIVRDSSKVTQFIELASASRDTQLSQKAAKSLSALERLAERHSNGS